MNAWQVAKQIKDLLKAKAWPDGTTDKVMPEVLVSAGVLEDKIGQLRFPFALINVGSMTPDEEEPGLQNQVFEVRLVHRVPGDAFGETALIGGARSGGQGSSEGRGLLEIEEILYDVIQGLREDTGIRLHLTTAGAVNGVELEGFGYIVSRSYSFDGWIKSARSYPAPIAFNSSVTGPTVTLTWENPYARYDRLSLVLRRASGSTAPASATSGTGVTVGALVETVTDAPGSGTWSYSLFMGYDDIGLGSVDRYSPAVSVTGVVVA